MKKLVSLSVAAMMLCCLTGCGKSNTLKCSISESNEGMDLKQTVEYTFNKSEASKVSMELTMKADKKYAEYIDQMADGFTEEFKELDGKKGVTVKSNKKGSSFTVSVSADLSKVDKDTREELDLGEGATRDELKKELTDQGYKCK